MHRETIRRRIRALAGAAAFAFLVLGPARGAAIDQVLREGDLEVRFRVSGTAITTAERVIVELEARSAGGGAPRIAGAGSRLGDFRVRSERIGAPRLGTDGFGVIRDARWVLEPYLPETYRIPPIEVSVERGGSALSVATPAIAVAVSSVLPAGGEPPKLRDLAPPVRNYGSWVPIVLLVVVVPPCMALVLRLLRGRERRGRAGADAEMPPPHEEALAELGAMGRGAGGATRLHEVFCRYMQLRFNQRTRGRSLEELSSRLNLDGSARTTFERLAEQLQRARYGPDEAAARAASSARELLELFVRQTAPEGRSEKA